MQREQGCEQIRVTTLEKPRRYFFLYFIQHLLTNHLSRSPQNRPRGHKDKKRRRGNDPNANEEELGQRGMGGFGRGRGGGNSGDKGDPPGKLPPWANPNEGQVMELCKFYVLERCAKREKCLYLHKGFPCKFFHCGMPEWQCPDTAESCKFSHEPLTDVTRPILLKV